MCEIRWLNSTRPPFHHISIAVLEFVFCLGQMTCVKYSRTSHLGCRHTHHYSHVVHFITPMNTNTTIAHVYRLLIVNGLTDTSVFMTRKQ